MKSAIGNPLSSITSLTQGNADNPNDDKHLINVLSDSLDEVMSYIVTEVTRETDTRTAQP
jgi:hypothetical protein